MWKLTVQIIFSIKKVWKADIVKVFSFTAMSTLVRMLTGLISVKIVATIIGPSGIALLGQLNNFSTIAMTIAGGGINNGITKYIAEYRESDEKIRDLLSTAFRITLWCSLATGILMIIFHQFLSRCVMLSPDYSYIFVIFGFTIFLYALNMMLASILNGYKDFKKYVLVNIVGSVVGLFFSLFLVLTFGLKGALISAVTFQSVLLFVTILMLRKCTWFSCRNFRHGFSYLVAKKYLGYALMTLVSVACVPVSQMIIRGYVIANISEVEAGWWEAMNRISGMYLMVVTSSLIVYYLPHLSEIKDSVELRREIFKTYKAIIPIIVSGFIVIYLFRHLIITLLFTDDFLPMSDLFIWQLCGDFFKISSWLLAFLMVAKSMTKIYIITEILGTILFVGLSFSFMKLGNGIVGIAQSYLLNYVLYMATMLIIFRKLIFSNK